MATARRVDREARSALAVLALVAVAFAAYAPAYAYDFAKWDGYVWDDDDHYLHDPLIAAPDGWWRIWLDPRPGLVGTQGGAAVWNYWPLTRGSLWLDRHLFGELAPGRPNLFATHVANVALHALNAVLVFLVLRGLGVPGALLAGFVFAVHPVTVESVAWITERKNLLSTACFLLAVDAWRRLAAGGRARWYVATAAFHLLALMAKTSTVVLPVVLALLHFGARRRFDARTCARLAPLFAMSLVAGVTSIVFERDFIDAGGAVTASLAERVAIAIRIPWFYLAKVVAPVGLAFNYPRWRIDGLGALEIALGAATVGLACGAFALRDRHPLARPVAVGLGAFLAGLFPVLGVFDLYGMRYANVADHWQYLPCIAPIALIAAGVARASERLPRGGRAARVAIGAAAVAALGSLTFVQSGAYRDAATLWRHTIEQQPRSAIAHNNLATHLREAGRPDEAETHYLRAIEADPRFVEPYVNLGNLIDARTGDRRRAAPWWRRALERDAAQPVALYNLAMTAIDAQDLATAESLLVRALDAQPTFAPALDLLGQLYRHQHRERALAARVERARAVVAAREAGGRGIAARIWLAMGAALAAVAVVAARERRAAARAA